MSHVFSRVPSRSLPVVARAEGAIIWDTDGRRYIDGAGGAIVVGIGHGRDGVADAIADQARRVAYAHGTAFTSEPLEAYAAELAPLLPMEDARIYPVSGGSEAVETALKLARAYHLARGAAVPPDDYWPAVRGVCDRYGVLLITDEVMTGFGRTGTWFGSDHWGLRPDILAAGKGTSSGYWPLGLAACRGEVYQTVASAGF